VRIVIAPDSFKGSMSALAAAQAMAAGVCDALPDAETILVPLADGGEGTVDAMAAAVPGSKTIPRRVIGPLGGDVSAELAVLADERHTVVVEMAAASGLTLVDPERRDPMRSSTFGTGQVIEYALSVPGIRRMVIGLGGSATNDCGVGALAALGVAFFDGEGRSIDGVPNAGTLPLISRADACKAPDTRGIEIIIACDVTNPLCGPNGAAAVFGPQKGVTPEMVPILDGYLAGFAPILDRIESQRRPAAASALDSTPIAQRPGAGAAGGLAAALMSVFPEAHVRPGIDIVLEVSGFDRLLEHADLVITGEGKLDAQTLSGKTIGGILRRTKPRGIRAIALAGMVDQASADKLRPYGLESAHALMDMTDSVEDAMAHGPELLRALARRVLAWS
jgi:glycerate kinase